MSTAPTSPSTNAIAGTSVQYTATATFVDHSTQDVTTSSTWNSSNPTVATIDTLGKATAVNTGTTNISATYQSINSNSSSLAVSHFLYLPSAISPVINQYPVLNTGALNLTSLTTGNIAANGLVPNSAHTYLYYSFTDSGNPSAGSCKINSVGALSSCTSYFTVGGADMNSIAIQGNFLYITNPTGNRIYYCTLSNSIPGAFSCFSSNFFPLTNATDIKASPTVNNLLYVSSQNGSTIYACTIDLTDGTITSCDVAKSGLAAPNQMAIDPTGQLAYVTGSTGTRIQACSIDQTTHLFGNCSIAVGQPFTVSQFIGSLTFNNTATKVYISATANGQAIAWCDVSIPSGAMSNCSTASATNGQGIAFV